MGGFWRESKDMHNFSRAVFAIGLMGSASLVAAADIIIDGQSIIGSDIDSISISPASGNIFVTTFPGYTVTKDTEPPPVNAVSIDTFVTSKTLMDEGDTAVLSWTTTNAVSCTTANGSTGWRAHTPEIPDGSKPVTLPTADTWVFTLNCDGESAGDTASRSVAIEVVDPNEPPPPPPPEPGNCPDPALTGTSQSWGNFWGVNFPGPTYDNKNRDIPRFGYHAISFWTGSVNDNGSLATLETTATAGARLGAVSECPGDFDVAPECQKLWGIGGAIMWATDGKAGACQLDNDKTYYFNITYTDGSDPSQSNCDGTPCRTKIQHANF